MALSPLLSLLPRDDCHVTTHFHRCVSIFCDTVILTSADVTVGEGLGWSGEGRGFGSVIRCVCVPGGFFLF